MSKEKYKVILFYKFVDIADTKMVNKKQREFCQALGLKGRMLIAEEGINATFEGTEEQIAAYEKAMSEGEWKEIFGEIKFKESEGNGRAFTKLQITIRPEVVTLKSGKFKVSEETAPTITAEELEKMYENDEDFVILDLRNDFEIEVGQFERTVDPGLRNFRDLPAKLKDLEHLKNKKIVAVCTGDIRCEKGTCLLKREGFENLYHLEDGIHAYMQKFPGSRFKGSLFVFDNRMTTPVVDTPNREIIGKCIFCSTKCEEFYSDDTTRPSKKVICCDMCVTEKGQHLRRCVTK